MRTGTYGSSSQTTFFKPGITITSYPGERATIAGYPLITGAGTTLSYLAFDLNDVSDPTPHCGTASVAYSLEIEASNVTLAHDNIYQSNVSPSLRSVAVGIGWSTVANHAVIRNSRIHDFGSCRDLDHGVYVSNSSGTQIYGDSFWNGPHGWAVQLYPSAHHSHVYRNVVDHVGSGFAIGGEGSDPSSYNQIDHNVIKNSTGLPAAGTRGAAISGYWAGSVGPDNVFDDNVSINNPGGISSGWGVTARGNKTVR